MENQSVNMCEKLFFRCPEGKDGLTNRITGFVLSLTNKCLCKLWVDSDVKVDYKQCFEMCTINISSIYLRKTFSIARFIALNICLLN